MKLAADVNKLLNGHGEHSVLSRIITDITREVAVTDRVVDHMAAPVR